MFAALLGAEGGYQRFTLHSTGPDWTAIAITVVILFLAVAALYAYGRRRGQSSKD